MAPYIHIGIGKTGTSAIQHFFYKNRDAFFEKGLIYPDIGLQGDVHNNLADLNCRHIPEETMRRYHKLRDLVDVHSKHSILLRETLKKSASGMECKAHGAQRSRHIREVGEERAPRNAAIRPRSHSKRNS